MLEVISWKVFWQPAHGIRCEAVTSFKLFGSTSHDIHHSLVELFESLLQID